MPTVFLTKTTDNGKEVVVLFIPDDQYPIFLQIMEALQLMLSEARSPSSTHQIITMSQVTTKFNDFLGNIHKKIIGAYEIMGVLHYDMDFTTQDNEVK